MDGGSASVVQPRHKNDGNAGIGHSSSSFRAEWKEVEKLAVEVALHPESFVGGNEALAARLIHKTKQLFDMGTSPSLEHSLLKYTFPF